MPRAKSGRRPWQLIAFKLPGEELEALRRAADIERVNISQILREGLALRLAGYIAAPTPTAHHIPVDVLLTDALRHFATCPQCQKEYNSITPTTGEEVRRLQEEVSYLTATDTLESNGLTTTDEEEVSRLTTTPEPSLDVIPEPYDQAKYALGPLCTNGHAYGDSGQSLRRLTDDSCLACERARTKASRARKRQGARGR